MISFRCESCGRSYSVKDEMGGRKVRCKDCNATIAIPEAEDAEIGLAPSSAFDDLLGPSGAKSPIEEEPNEALPRRPGKVRPGGSKPRVEKQPFVTVEQVRSMGVTFLLMGIGGVVLPLAGLQFRLFKNLPENVIIPLGVGSALFGGLLLLISMAMGRSRSGSGSSAFAILGKVVAIGCLGVIAVIGLIIVLAVILPGLAGGGKGGGGQVAQAPDGPAGNATAEAAPNGGLAPNPSAEGVASNPPGGMIGGPPAGPFGRPPGLPQPPTGFGPGGGPPRFGPGGVPIPPGSITTENSTTRTAAAPLASSSSSSVDALLTDLNSGNAHAVQIATGRLGAAGDWPEDRRADVATALASVATSSTDRTLRDVAGRALVSWVTPDQMPALRQMLADDHFVVRRHALDALAAIGSVEAAEIAVSAVDAEGPFVIRSLKAIGPAAEPATLRLMDHPEWNIRMEASRLLGEIGSASSIPALQRATNDSNGIVQNSARQSLDAIGRRQ